MVRKKVDGRVQGLIEQGVRRNHRSVFVIVGDHGKDQVWHDCHDCYSAIICLSAYLLKYL